MSNRKKNILEAAQRMQYFSEANSDLAAELPSTVELFAANADNVARLEAAGIASATVQSAGISETRSKVTRAREIALDLRLISKTAKIIEKKNKDFVNTFALSRGAISYQEILEKGAAFVSAAQTNLADFSKYALNAAFFTALQTDLADLRETMQDQSDAKRESVGSTVSIEEILGDTLDTREELTRALKNHYRDDPAKLAEWLTASHIERKKKKAGAPDGTDENPPPAPQT